MKSKIISLCGLECSDCPCFLAFKNNDQALRIKTAKKWSADFGWKNLLPEDINCRGCLSDRGPIFKHCRECGVRICGKKEKVANCGKCLRYINCSKIASLHKMIPDGKAICDKINRE